jgi:hypothetical protein
MLCPKCRHIELQPTKIDDGLPAMGCPSCEGSLISLLYYREWAENNVGSAMKIDRLRKAIGDGDTAKAIEVKAWLRDHKAKAAILQFLGSD